MSPDTMTRSAIVALLDQNRGLFASDGSVEQSGPGAVVAARMPGAGRPGAPALALTYGFHPSPFGEAILVTHPEGLVGLGFVDDGDRAAALADMRGRWPAARFAEDAQITGPLAASSFEPGSWRSGAPVPLALIGTTFETDVWTTLLRIPLGRATTYSALAAHLGRPSASRAVGAAVGKNPISFVVPCHRVVGSSGHLTGYHWGLARKQQMLGWEAGRRAAA